MRVDTMTGLDRLPPEVVERLDRDCDRFEESWMAGQRPRIEEYLDRVEGLERAAWLCHLLDLELHHRRSRGERPEWGEYRSRFPGFEAAVDALFDRSAPSASPDLELGPGPTGHQTVPRPLIDPEPSPSWHQGDAIAELIGAGALEPSARPGTVARLGRFDILGVVGCGGMGVVLRASDPATGEWVAIKVLRPHLADGSLSEAMFCREARHLSRLSHPSILRVTGVAGPGEWPYYVMPYLARGPLSARIDGRPMDPAEALSIARQVASALDYLHGRGLIHRDLKPANILLGEGDRVFLADFGLARPLHGDTLLDPEHSHCVGTVAYMSPAVASGRAEDTRCDIYSFGAVLREMLTGRPPYIGRTAPEVLRQVMTTAPAPILSVRPQADPRLARIAECAMERELRHRYAAMADVIIDLDRAARGQPPLLAHGRRRRPPWRAIIRVLVAVLAALGILLALGSWFYRRIAAGDLDATFGDGGRVFTDVSELSDDNARALVIQPDGRIVVVGCSSESGRRVFAAVRYRPDGATDGDFGTAGRVLTDLGGESDVADVALQPDDRIIVVGNVARPGSLHDFAVVRYNADGSPDRGFGARGQVVADLGSDDYAAAVAVQPDGKIVVVGPTGTPGRRDMAVVRYNADGSPDDRFGTGGIRLADLGSSRPSDDVAIAVAVQPDGKIVVAGYSNRPGSYDFAVVRLNADGSPDDGSPLDTTPGDRFAADGAAFVHFGGRAEIWSMALQPDGKIVVAGFSWSASEGAILLDTLGTKMARLDADGHLDGSFGKGGKVSTDLPGNDRTYRIALQSDGKIVAAVSLYRSSRAIERRGPPSKSQYVVVERRNRASPTFDVAVVRYRPDGTLDGEFGERGVVLTEFDPAKGSGHNGVAVQPDGKIVVAGTSERPTGRDFAVLRYMGRTHWVRKPWPWSRPSTSPPG